MDKIIITGNSAALDADGLANDVAYSGGGYALTANSAGDSIAHLITILGNAATNHSAKTFTVTGTGPGGEAQTEGIAGPNGVATVTTTKHFLTVTSVTVSSTTGADTFDIGWTAESVSAWEPLDSRVEAFNIGFGCIVVSGSPTYTVQHTYGDASLTPFSHATVSAETTSQEGAYTNPVQAIRLKWTAAGEVTLAGRQATRKL